MWGGRRGSKVGTSARDGGGRRRPSGRWLVGGLAVLLSVCLVGVVVALSAAAGKTARPATASSPPSSTPTFDAARSRPEARPTARRLISSSERASVAAQRSTSPLAGFHDGLPPGVPEPAWALKKHGLIHFAPSPASVRTALAAASASTSPPSPGPPRNLGCPGQNRRAL